MEVTKWGTVDRVIHTLFEGDTRVKKLEMQIACFNTTARAAQRHEIKELLGSASFPSSGFYILLVMTNSTRTEQLQCELCESI